MSNQMIPLTEERKQDIVNEEPGGLWLVLDEEYPRNQVTAGDLLCGEPVEVETGRRALKLSSYPSVSALAAASSARSRD